MKYRNQAIKYGSQILTATQAAEYMSISTQTLANWRCRGFPNLPYSRLGRCIRYRMSDIEAYLEKNSYNIKEA